LKLFKFDDKIEYFALFLEMYAFTSFVSNILSDTAEETAGPA